MEILFDIGCTLFVAGAIIAALVRSLERALTLYVAALTVGAVLNLAFALAALFALPAVGSLFSIIPGAARFFRADGLALFFLLVITTVAIPIILATHSYLQQYLKKPLSVRLFLVFFSALILSTQLLVLANHAIVFLIFWELMTLTAYLGTLLEKEKEEVQKGSFIYFVTTHIATFFLYIFFFILHHESGSWLLSDFHLTSASGVPFYAVCFFGFMGFGIKAGFMPVHFWLPWAHPIAPTVLSAFLSGVIIKTGIYGIFRIVEICSPLPVWIGVLILGVSLFSAIFGVWYALAQHDIKKLLAYHSIENIGIIGIGIGIGVIGLSYSVQSLVWLGFGGALFHTFNHAIFKSLLFLGSGVIYRNLHTRIIEQMGGIVHRAPWFVLLFLIGSIAISGIPPLNGFMSEFLIYRGLFESASSLGMYYPFFMLLMAVGLAFVGGLALACFTKINSIMFLGTERRELPGFAVSTTEYISMGSLAILCIIFGFYPQPVLRLISSVITFGNWGVPLQPYTIFAQWGVLSLVLVTVLATCALVLIWKKLVQRQRISPPWGCGFAPQTSRMQYTASSYADEINSIAATMLHMDKHVIPPTTIFPKAARFSSHTADFSERSLIGPMYRYVLHKVNTVEFLSRTDVRHYISFMLMAVLVYGGIAIIWTYF